MNLTELERQVLLALLEQGAGNLNILEKVDLRKLLRCTMEDLQKSVEHLRGMGMVADNNSGTAEYLTPTGREEARELKAAPERERLEKAEARRRFWLSNLERLVWLVVGFALGLGFDLVRLYLAKRWNLNP